MLLQAGRLVSSLTVKSNGGPLSGVLRVPGDKSISHRALLIAGLAHGTSRITGLSSGLDVVATRKALEAFGVAVEPAGAPGAWNVTGGSRSEPGGVIDVGNSGTSIRLLSGWAASLDALSVLVGDDSISRRPMGRVVEPLSAMGAKLDGRSHATLPPLVVRGGHLHGVDYEVPVPSAQVKGAVLLAGLSAEGATTVREALATRAHTEEMLPLWGADVTVEHRSVTVRPSRLDACAFHVPGDPSQAAFWVVAACVTPGSDVTVEKVYLGRGRAGFVDVLQRMGANVEVADYDPLSSVGDLHASYGPLRATTVGGDEVPSLIDEIPVLAVAAALASGTTTFADAGELRHKESDRVASTVGALRAVGFQAEGRPDGLVVEGSAGRPARGGTVDPAGDHRVAMSMAVAALAASGPVVIQGWECVQTSYPSFEEDMARCRPL